MSVLCNLFLFVHHTCLCMETIFNKGLHWKKRQKNSFISVFTVRWFSGHIYRAYSEIESSIQKWKYKIFLKKIKALPNIFGSNVKIKIKQGLESFLFARNFKCSMLSLGFHLQNTLCCDKYKSKDTHFNALNPPINPPAFTQLFATRTLL